MASRAFAIRSIDTKFVMHCTRGFSALHHQVGCKVKDRSQHM